MPEEEALERIAEVFGRNWGIAQEVVKEWCAQHVGCVEHRQPSTANIEGTTVLVRVDEEAFRDVLAEDPSRLSLTMGVGAWLGVIDLKDPRSIVLCRVVESHRQEAFSAIAGQREIPFSAREFDPKSLATSPTLALEPTIAYDIDAQATKLPVLPFEPFSPVFLLRPEKLQQALGLPEPERGLSLGLVSIGDRPYMVKVGDEVEGAVLALSTKALFQHILVVGTTGTGKTTLLKNLILDVSKKGSEVGIDLMLALDRNRDFLYALFKPRWSLSGNILEAEEEIALASHRVKPHQVRGLDLAILLPLTSHLVNELGESLEALARNYLEQVIAPIAERLSARIEVLSSEVGTLDGGSPYASLKVSIDHGDGEYVRQLFVIPFALKYGGNVERLVEVDPYFTELAKRGLPPLVNEIKRNESILSRVREAKKNLESLDGLVYALSITPRSVYERFMHQESFRNAFRTLSRLLETGCVDVRVKVGEEEKVLDEPDIDALIKFLRDRQVKLAVVDLSVIDDATIVNMLCYILLDMLRKRILRAEAPINMLMLLDEAHAFFPKRRDDYGEKVEGLISTLARLGRQRGLGLIFSTHRVADLNRLVITLTNTKIVFRTSRDETEDAEVPSSWRDFVTNMPDRTALIKSHIIKAREGVLTFRTPLPLLGHREV